MIDLRVQINCPPPQKKNYRNHHPPQPNEERKECTYHIVFKSIILCEWCFIYAALCVQTRQPDLHGFISLSVSSVHLSDLTNKTPDLLLVDEKMQKQAKLGSLSNDNRFLGISKWNAEHNLNLKLQKEKERKILDSGNTCEEMPVRITKFVWLINCNCLEQSSLVLFDSVRILCLWLQKRNTTSK